MKIIEYPHPTLRHKNQPLKRVDAEVRAVVDKMFELMHEAKGVGLAANQVDLPYRLFVTGVPDESDESDDELEHLVFINPVIGARKGTHEAEEGCLSLPGLYAPVKRPAEIKVTAYDFSGEPFTLELSGLPARVVQHETDHLDGVLFIDRLSPTAEMDLKEGVAEFEAQFRQMRESGKMPTDDEIAARLSEIERKYC